MSEGKEPRIYVDTNVILDVIERRRKKDDSFLLLDKIKNECWYCCTSAYTICELIDKEQEFLHMENLLLKRYTLDEILKSRKPKDLSQEQRDDAIDKVRGFFKQYKIEQFTLEEKGWETTYAVLRNLNVSASDAVQVATAIEAGCSIFITNDRELGEEVQKKLMWMAPAQANQTLKGKNVTKEI